MADKDDIKIWLKHAILLLLLRNKSLWDVQSDFRKCKLACVKIFDLVINTMLYCNYPTFFYQFYSRISCRNFQFYFRKYYSHLVTRVRIYVINIIELYEKKNVVDRRFRTQFLWNIVLARKKLFHVYGMYKVSSCSHLNRNFFVFHRTSRA